MERITPPPGPRSSSEVDGPEPEKGKKIGDRSVAPEAPERARTAGVLGRLKRKLSGTFEKMAPADQTRAEKAVSNKLETVLKRLGKMKLSGLELQALLGMTRKADDRQGSGRNESVKRALEKIVTGMKDDPQHLAKLTDMLRDLKQLENEAASAKASAKGFSADDADMLTLLVDLNATLDDQFTKGFPELRGQLSDMRSEVLDPLITALSMRKSLNAELVEIKYGKFIQEAAGQLAELGANLQNGFPRGPDQVPQAAAKFGALAKRFQGFTAAERDRVVSEMVDSLAKGVHPLTKGKAPSVRAAVLNGLSLDKIKINMHIGNHQAAFVKNLDAGSMFLLAVVSSKAATAKERLEHPFPMPVEKLDPTQKRVEKTSSVEADPVSARELTLEKASAKFEEILKSFSAKASKKPEKSNQETASKFNEFAGLLKKALVDRDAAKKLIAMRMKTWEEDPFRVLNRRDDLINALHDMPVEQADDESIDYFDDEALHYAMESEKATARDLLNFFIDANNRRMRGAG